MILLKRTDVIEKLIKLLQRRNVYLLTVHKKNCVRDDKRKEVHVRDGSVTEPNVLYLY